LAAARHREPDTHWQQAADLYRTALSDDHTCYFAPLGTGGVVVLNYSADQILNAFRSATAKEQVIHSLPPDLDRQDVKAAIEQLATLGLIQPAGMKPTLKDGNALTLSAWLHVTSACNLHCRYCYAPRSDRAMDRETGMAALSAVFDAATRHGYQKVKLKYAGGEPLLNFGLVQAMHHQAVDWSRQHHIGLQEVVLSNGTLLTDDILDILREMRVRLTISLDGTGSSHDAQRPTDNNEGSFEEVARGIDRAVARGMKPHLSITLAGEHVAGAADAVAFALDRHLPFSLGFVRKP